MKTPEKSVEEIVEELRNKILDIETAVRLTYNEKDSDQMINKLLNHYTQTLQAERQKREEMVEAERERVVDYFLSSKVIRQKFAAVGGSRDAILKALTQPNNPK